MSKDQVCTRCIYDESIPNITFDENGVCNNCKMIDSLVEEYRTGTEKGKKALELILDEIKRKGRKLKYDCIIGVSGGTDSSYLLYWATQNGLRPLAVHYDNTWNSAISTENIKKVTSKLDIDLYTYVVNNKEADDIFRSFINAGVPELEASTDLALAEILYRASSKYGVKFILEGHSFLTEGITPLGKNYFDGKYIKSIHKKFGEKKIKTYPNMTFIRFLFWTLIKRIRKIRPYWYINYSKEEARRFLEKEFGWNYYGGHHLENRMTAFMHSYYLINKFDIDYRLNTLAALVRNKKITREAALEEFSKPPFMETELLNYFLKRMKFTKEEFDKIMSLEPKYWWNYSTYKKRFERLRPLFYILAKANLVPMSFYLKYCFPVQK